MVLRAAKWCRLTPISGWLSPFFFRLPEKKICLCGLPTLRYLFKVLSVQDYSRAVRGYLPGPSNPLGH